MSLAEWIKLVAESAKDLPDDVYERVASGFDAHSGRVHPNNCPIVKAVEGLEYQITPPSHKGEWE